MATEGKKGKGINKDFGNNIKHTLNFIEILFTVAKTWKQSKCPLTDE